MCSMWTESVQLLLLLSIVILIVISVCYGGRYNKPGCRFIWYYYCWGKLFKDPTMINSLINQNLLNVSETMTRIYRKQCHSQYKLISNEFTGFGFNTESLWYWDCLVSVRFAFFLNTLFNLCQRFTFKATFKRTSFASSITLLEITSNVSLWSNFT